LKRPAKIGASPLKQAEERFMKLKKLNRSYLASERLEMNFRLPQKVRSKRAKTKQTSRF
jgi:hypothetical protein